MLLVLTVLFRACNDLPKEAVKNARIEMRKAAMTCNRLEHHSGILRPKPHKKKPFFCGSFNASMQWRPTHACILKALGYHFALRRCNEMVAL